MKLKSGSFWCLRERRDYPWRPGFWLLIHTFYRLCCRLLYAETLYCFCDDVVAVEEAAVWASWCAHASCDPWRVVCFAVLSYKSEVRGELLTCESSFLDPVLLLCVEFVDWRLDWLLVGR